MSTLVTAFTPLGSKTTAEAAGLVTNCITKIPQDIKFELSSEGTLTLKAGSKAWYPNGKDEEGNLLFDSTVTASDITWVFTDTANWDNMFVFLGGNKRAQAFRPTGSTNSGSADPGTTGTTYYNISDNYIDAHNTTGLDRGLTFPLAIVSVEAGKVTQIKQVFNGFGYLGQVLYVLPGVEGLSPDGRNADGSLKNITLTTTSVVTREINWELIKSQYFGFGYLPNNPEYYGGNLALISSNNRDNAPGYFQQNEAPTKNNYEIWHRLDENKLYRTENSTDWMRLIWVPIGSVFNTGADTNISEFYPADTVRALNFYDTKYISKLGAPSDKYITLSIGASDSVYTAPANGYFCITAKASETSTAYIQSSVTPSYGGKIPMTTYQYVGGGAVVPIKAGQTVQIYYQSNVTMQGIRFVFAEGDK